MRCADCGFYECALRTPLGGCPNGEKAEHSQIITTPDTRPYDLGHGPFEKDYQPADAMKALDEKIKKVSEKGTWDGVDVDKYMEELRGRDPELQQAASNLVDAVDRYTMGKCLRSELLIKNNELKKLL